jgi:hypothetical protein
MEEFRAFGCAWNQTLRLLYVMVYHLRNIYAQLFSVELKVLIRVHICSSSLLHLCHFASVFFSSLYWRLEFFDCVLECLLFGSDLGRTHANGRFVELATSELHRSGSLVVILCFGFDYLLFARIESVGGFRH